MKFLPKTINLILTFLPLVPHLGYSLLPVPRAGFVCPSRLQLEPCSPPWPGPALGVAAIRPGGLAAEKVLSRGVLTFEPVAEKKAKGADPLTAP